MQNEVGITALQPEDIKQTNIPQGASSRKARRDEFKELSPQEQEQRRVQGLKKIKKDMKTALPFVSQGITEFALGVDLLRQFGFAPDLITQEKFLPSTGETIAGGIAKFKEGQKLEGGTDVAIGGLETLSAGADAIILSSVIGGPLAPILLAGGVAFKGLTKAGLAILKSPKGKTFFAKITGNDIQNTPRKDGDGTEPTINVESIVAEKPEDLEELGNIDNVPTEFTGELSTEDLLSDKYKRKIIFKSRLNEAIDTLQQKATGKQFLQTLKKRGNFSKDELKHSGLEDFLNSEQNNQGSISLSDIKNYMSQNTPEFVVEKRTTSGTSDDLVTDLDFDDGEAIPFGESGDYDFQIENAEEYITENSPDNPLNELIYLKVLQRDGANESESNVPKGNFEQFANDANLTAKEITELEKKAEKIIEKIPSYESAIAQIDMFEPSKRQAILGRGRNQYYMDEIYGIRRKEKEDLDMGEISKKYFGDNAINVIENIAEKTYMNNPEMIYRDRTSGYEIIELYGGDSYDIRRPDGSLIDRDVYSLNEARIQATQDAIERGEIEYEPDDEADYAQRVGRTMFDRFTSKLGSQGAYEEDPYYINSKLSQEKSLFSREDGHFRQENNVGHLRHSLISPTSAQGKGRSIFLVEEFQQDPINVAKRDFGGGFAPTKDDIAEIQKIIGEDELSVGSTDDAFVPALNIKDKQGNIFFFEEDVGYVSTRMVEGQERTYTKHPKNEELLKFFKKNKINPRSRVDGDLPNKNDGYKFNFRFGLAQAVDKNQSHMHYVAGESHALAYGEAKRLIGVDRVPAEILKKPIQRFNEIVKDDPEKLGNYNIPLDTRANRPYDLKEPTENTFQARLEQHDSSDEDFLKAVKDEDVQFYEIGEDTIIEGTTDDLNKILKKMYGDDYEALMIEDEFQIRKVIPEGQTYVNRRSQGNTEKVYSVVAGRDGNEIVLPFDIEEMQKNNPDMASRLEGYASGKTQDDFFDDLMVVDIKYSIQTDQDAVRHLLVNKENNDVLGSFINQPIRPNETRPVGNNDLKILDDKANEDLPYFFKQNEVNILVRDGGDTKDVTPKNLKDFLTDEEISELKRDEAGSLSDKTNREAYYDEFTDIDKTGDVIGGFGKKKLYNEMINKYAEKYLKKIDPDVEIYRELMENSEGNMVPTYGFKITDKIRKHILLEGIESFKRGGAVIFLQSKQKIKPQKKYVPTITVKKYGSFIDKNKDPWNYIDG